LPLLENNMTVNYMTEIFLFVTDVDNFSFKNFSPYYRRMTQLQSGNKSPKEDVSCEYNEKFTDAQIWDCAVLMSPHHSYYHETKS